jgi:hypothetical protein
MQEDEMGVFALRSTNVIELVGPRLPKPLLENRFVPAPGNNCTTAPGEANAWVGA